MDWLVDTCVIIRGWQGKGSAHQVFKSLVSGDPRLGVTDFTLLELKEKAPHELYRLVSKSVNGKVLKTGIKPGDWKGETAYEIKFDPELLRLIPDPSDAVLIAAAEHYKMKGVITIDRHHLYTAKLENYLERKGLEVLEPGEFVKNRLAI